MKCPKCGNEVSPEEAFCGQCGTPNSPPARPTETVSTPPPRSGHLSSYNTPFVPPLSQVYNAPTTANVPPPTTPYAPRDPSYSQPGRPSSPGQQEGFYQDATEAMPATPGMTGQGNGYPPPGVSMPNGYPGVGQYGPPMQPFQSGNYAQPFPTEQGYQYGGITSPPQKQRSTNTAVIIASICLVVALISAIGLGTLYLLRTHNQNNANTPGPSPNPTSVATAAATPTLTPSPTVAPTNTPMPSPTVASTPAPDSGFAWCSQLCTNNGFLVEYPQNWQIGPADNANGVKFTSPIAPNQFAAFKATGPTSSTPDELVAGDLQANFQSKQGYTPPTSSSPATIGNVTGVTQIAYYQNNSQKVRIEVYAIVHQGKAYIVELQAPESQFESINAQYFENMLGRFQFV